MPEQRRGRVIAMSAGEVDTFLGQERTCRLATLGPDGPHVSPVWFTWTGGALWVYSLTRSQRWADLQRDPRVSAVIDGGHHYAELHGVEIEGQAAVVGPVPRTGDADQQVPELAEPERLMAEKYFGAGDMTHDGQARLAAHHAGQDHQLGLPQARHPAHRGLAAGLIAGEVQTR